MSHKFNKLFENKVVLITGGTGSIGSQIVEQLLGYNCKQIRVYSRDESKHFFMQNRLAKLDPQNKLRFIVGDVRDKDRLDESLAQANYVFHTAALKHLPYCEINIQEAIKTNIYGTQNVIDMAIKHGVEKVVSVSTDKAVEPHSFMGITKLMMERMITAPHNHLGKIKTKFSVVRFGNVLHSRGSVIPLWQNQVEQGGPVTVTSKKMKRFFMETSQAVELVFSATQLMKGREVFVLQMKQYNIYELAQKIIAQHPQGKGIKIKLTGAREREKDEEFLYTRQEAKTMITTSKFYILQPNTDLLNKRKNSYRALV